MISGFLNRDFPKYSSSIYWVTTYMLIMEKQQRFSVKKWQMSWLQLILRTNYALRSQMTNFFSEIRSTIVEKHHFSTKKCK